MGPSQIKPAMRQDYVSNGRLFSRTVHSVLRKAFHFPERPQLSTIEQGSSSPKLIRLLRLSVAPLLANRHPRTHSTVETWSHKHPNTAFFANTKHAATPNLAFATPTNHLEVREQKLCKRANSQLR